MRRSSCRRELTEISSGTNGLECGPGPGLQGLRRVLSDHILATPTLIKLSPAPVRKIIGDVSEELKVLLALELQQRTT